MRAFVMFRFYCVQEEEEEEEASKAQESERSYLASLFTISNGKVSEAQAELFASMRVVQPQPCCLERRHCDAVQIQYNMLEGVARTCTRRHICG